MYQPPGAMHCPDCNVCVEGYDHHCPWMGICIGKRNYKKFMTFNITWLTYLIYAGETLASPYSNIKPLRYFVLTSLSIIVETYHVVVWVTAIGPRMSKNPDPNPGE